MSVDARQPFAFFIRSRPARSPFASFARFAAGAALNRCGGCTDLTCLRPAARAPRSQVLLKAHEIAERRGLRLIRHRARILPAARDDRFSPRGDSGSERRRARQTRRAPRPTEDSWTGVAPNARCRRDETVMMTSKETGPLRRVGARSGAGGFTWEATRKLSALRCAACNTGEPAPARAKKRSPASRGDGARTYGGSGWRGRVPCCSGCSRRSLSSGDPAREERGRSAHGAVPAPGPTLERRYSSSARCCSGESC
jgi:hypothetical protein